MPPRLRRRALLILAAALALVLGALGVGVAAAGGGEGSLPGDERAAIVQITSDHPRPAPARPPVPAVTGVVAVLGALLVRRAPAHLAAAGPVPGERPPAFRRRGPPVLPAVRVA
jgi:hypothetical protein